MFKNRKSIYHDSLLFFLYLIFVFKAKFIYIVNDIKETITIIIEKEIEKSQ